MLAKEIVPDSYVFCPGLTRTQAPPEPDPRQAETIETLYTSQTHSAKYMRPLAHDLFFFTFYFQPVEEEERSESGFPFKINIALNKFAVVRWLDIPGVTDKIPSGSLIGSYFRRLRIRTRMHAHTNART